MNVALLALLACSPGSRGPDDTGAVGDTADTGPDVDTGSCVVPPGPPDARDTGDGPLLGDTLDGSVVWTLDFDAAAEAAGYVDCTYARSYVAQAQIVDRGYLCPDCDLLTLGDGEMTSGYEDCYLQISDADAVRAEHLGLGDVDGAPHFFRSGLENLSLGDMGAIVGTADAFDVAWEDEGEVDGGGTMLLTAAGSFTRNADVVQDLADPEAARAEPYACGWPQNNPGGPNASWDVAVGAPFPNVRLDDQCGEPVDLWDFLGFYLVVDASSPDCGPCQAMAADAEAFKARMAEQCVPVELITVLNASLGDVLAPADLDMRNEWADTFGLSSPVLADQGFGYAVMAAALQDEGISLPTVFVVDPDGVAIAGQTGFGSWDDYEALILDDWASRP